MQCLVIDFARDCDYHIINLFCGNYTSLHYSTYSTGHCAFYKILLTAEKSGCFLFRLKVVCSEKKT